MQSRKQHHNHTDLNHDEHTSVASADSHAQTAHLNHAENQHGNQTSHARSAHEVHPQMQEGKHVQHVDHMGHEELFRKRFWVSLLLSIPVLLFTPMLQMWFGFMMPEFVGSQWVAPLFSVMVFLYGGVPFIQMAIPEIRNRQPGMMLLVSLAISVSF
ncbi:MAG: heavy metal translocating P-type ATPase, partial [Chloroflexi bacterium]